MQSIRTYVKKPVFIAIFIIALVIGFVFVASDFFNQIDETDCQRYNYTEKLNGGVKEFQGKKYKINICGSGVNNSHIFGNSMDKVELTVLDEHGVLLAKRHYKVFWDGQPGHEPLNIRKDSITYQDDENQKDYKITMPPSLFEWIKARVSLLN